MNATARARPAATARLRAAFRPALLALALAGALRAQDAAPAFSFEALCERATELATHDHVPAATDDLPEWLAKLDYDGYQQLRPKLDAALWLDDGLPFAVDFKHRGYLYRRRVALHIVEDGRVTDLAFQPAHFHYEDDHGPIPDDLGYAGFSIRHLGSEPARWDEIVAFLGASYFRLAGIGQAYGASARGLAIDTAEPQGEEFPDFTEFWLEKPKPGATQITLHALLDSPGVAGAFRFVITPGADMVVEVTACLVARHRIGKLCVAPLTSMFLFGEDGLHRVPDYRPEVHDSDGLLIDDGHGQWLWRPLGNPTHAHRIARFPTEDPAGFGLLQRDRDFGHYEDLQARFELRPGFWIAPRGNWGKGAVELVEIPSNAEGNDNIVAYWVPEQPVAEGDRFRFEYTLTAALELPGRPPLARALNVLVRPDKEQPLFVLDFEEAGRQDGEGALNAEVTTSRGTIRDLVLQPNVAAGGERCAFRLAEAGSEPLQLRVRLLRGERPVSETLVLDWVAP